MTNAPRITIDFESRSACDIGRGAWLYSKHASTEPLCLAYKIGDAKTKLWHPGYAHLGIVESPYPQDLMDAIDDGWLVEAHNRFFEFCMWSNIMQPLWGWRPIKREQWRCSAAKAAYYSLPRALENAVKALKMSVEKDMEGNKIMKKLCKPRKPSKLERSKLLQEGINPDTVILWHESVEDFERNWLYCENDVEAEHAFSELLPDLPPEELRIWQMDQDMNLRGVRCDLTMVKSALRMRDREVTAMNAELADIMGIPDNEREGFGASQRAKVKDWINTQGVALPDTQAATLDKFAEKKLPAEIIAAINIVREVNRSSTAKYEAMLERVDVTDWRLRDLMMYHGASTGRWAGKGVQPHNFPRGDIKLIDLACQLIIEEDYHAIRALFGEVMEHLSYALRGAMTATLGRDLIVADFAAIEARVVFWLAGDDTALNVFRSGKDIYCLTGDTKVLTTKGAQPIGALKHATLLDGNGHWVECDIYDHGKQNVYEITFASGNVTKRVKASAEHIWISDDKRVTTAELSRGVKINRLQPKKQVTDEALYRRGVVHGLVYGDGSHVGRGNDYRLGVYSHAEDHIPWLTDFVSTPAPYVTTISKGTGLFYHIPSSYAMGQDFKALPNTANQDYLLGFMRGWLMADGTVSIQPAASITTTRPEGIEWAQRWAPLIGWQIAGVSEYESSSQLPGSHKRLYRLNLHSSSMEAADFLIAQHRNRWQTKTPPPRPWSVRSVTYAGQEQVYCPVVPTTRSFALADAIHSGNCDMATGIYGFEVKKKENPVERQFGKQAILGLGFEMGFVTFLLTCRKYDIVFSVDQCKRIVGDQWNMLVEKIEHYFLQDKRRIKKMRDAELSIRDNMHVLVLMQFTVNKYRARYPEVKQMWRDQEEGAVQAIRNPGMRIDCKRGRNTWVVETIAGHPCLVTYLASGKPLHYWYPKLELRKTPFKDQQGNPVLKPVITFWAVDPYTKKWSLQDTYGGKLVENITQATARDLMALAMVRADDGGTYDVLLSVHDELVCEVDKDKGNVKEFERLISETPGWAEGCPVDAEGWRGERYRK